MNECFQPLQAKPLLWHKQRLTQNHTLIWAFVLVSRRSNSATASDVCDDSKGVGNRKESLHRLPLARNFMNPMNATKISEAFLKRLMAPSYHHGAPGHGRWRCRLRRQLALKTPSRERRVPF